MLYFGFVSLPLLKVVGLFTLITISSCLRLRRRNIYAIDEYLSDDSVLSDSSTLHVALSKSQFNRNHAFNDISLFYGESSTSFKIKPPIDWSNIVFMIYIYSSSEQDRMVEAHFNTWLRHIGEGADVVYITDADDSRSVEEILPFAQSATATFHLYKSPAPKEGKHLRFKVIDGFQHVAEKKFKFKKNFFIKMDYDNYVVSDRLLAYLNSLHYQTYPKPVHFGRSNCYNTICYTEGGFYGFNNVGFRALVHYFEEYPGIATGEHFKFQNEMKLLMQHEDFMVSFVYRDATQYPMIHAHLYTRNFGSNPTTLKVTSYLKHMSEGIAFHGFKDPNLLYESENFFFEEWNRARTR